jgi:hypothetical protein
MVSPYSWQPRSDIDFSEDVLSTDAPTFRDYMGEHMRDICLSHVWDAMSRAKRQVLRCSKGIKRATPARRWRSGRSAPIRFGRVRTAVAAGGALAINMGYSSGEFQGSEALLVKSYQGL